MKKNEIGFTNQEVLEFFGKVNANISHELKNILAIISETAGFLNDLTELARQGNDIELSMLENCSSSIAEEIQRGFDTIKQMNKFAHSVDVPIREIDLQETMALMVKLSGFLSYASKVKMDKPAARIDPILTFPFLFQNLIYDILCFTYQAADTYGEITIAFESKDSKGTHLILSTMTGNPSKDFPDDNIRKAADALGVKIAFNSTQFKLDLWIPYRLNNIDQLAEAP